MRGARTREDPLTDVAALAAYVPNWRAMLHYGLEAGDVSTEGEAMAGMIEARLRTRRPLAVDEWLADMEKVVGRKLRRAKPGPKPKGDDD